MTWFLDKAFLEKLDLRAYDAPAIAQRLGMDVATVAQFVDPARRYLVQRADIKRVGYVIVSSDRGLAGGLNNNMFRKLLVEFRGWQEKGVEIDVVTIGQKASVFFRRLKVGMLASVTHLGDVPHVEQLVGVIKVMLDAYTAGSVDKVFLSYNAFVNTMTQAAPLVRLRAQASALRVCSNRAG